MPLPTKAKSLFGRGKQARGLNRKRGAKSNQGKPVVVFHICHKPLFYYQSVHTKTLAHEADVFPVDPTYPINDRNSKLSTHLF